MSEEGDKPLDASALEKEREKEYRASTVLRGTLPRYVRRNKKENKTSTPPEHDGTEIAGREVAPPPERYSTTTADRGASSVPELEHGVMSPGQKVLPPKSEELAVAITVTEDDNRSKYPTAEEYDPDAKPPLLNNRRFQLYACTGICICLSLIALAIASIILFREEPTEAPTSSPTKLFEDILAYDANGDDPPRNAEKLAEKLRNIVGDEINEEGTMEHAAARWIIYDDPRELHSDDPTLTQRFLLSLFYLKTTRGGESPWRSCNKPGPNDNSTCQHLRFHRLTNNTIEYNPEDGIRWLSEEHECNWVGCICDDNKFVRALQIVGQNITGPLPTNLVELAHLQSLSVAHNALTGTIPSAYASVLRLLSFEVHYNQFSGPFPKEYFQMTRLQNLNICSNQLTGTLSPEFGRLTNLKALHLYSNFFTGTIPPEIFDIDYLTYTRFSGNILDGTIPSSVGKAAQMQEIWLGENQLNGTIPSEVGLLTNLLTFNVNWNKLKGSIPSEIYNARYLLNLNVYGNRLTGTLDDRIGNLTDLKFLGVYRNRLEGTIPKALEKLTALDSLMLHLNHFEGGVPPGLCDDGVNIEIFQSDCFPRRNPPNPCKCCTSCCYRVSEMCLIIDDDLEIEYN